MLLIYVLLVAISEGTLYIYIYIYIYIYGRPSLMHTIHLTPEVIQFDSLVCNVCEVQVEKKMILLFCNVTELYSTHYQ